jgi:hypothetical protein
MRTTGDVYWSTSLPKDHEALQELDAYCKEWGGLTRAEASRRLLIEWAMLRKGKDLSAWGPGTSVSGSPERARRAGGAMQKPPFMNATAKAASQVLDE